MKLRTLIDQENSLEALDMSFVPKEWDHVILPININNYVTVIADMPKDCVVINLCDGMDEEGELGECVIRELEKHKLPYTGSSINCYKCKKSDLKVPGIKTPKCVVIKNKQYDENTFDHLSFPVMIKPEYNCASTGITELSKANTLSELMERLAVYEFKDIVVEEFIEGREFTALICDNVDGLGPIPLEPIECVFSKGYTFKHHHLKWVDFNALNYETITDAELSNRIMEMAKDTYIKLNLDGYIRYDIRMNKNGDLFIVDANTYPGIFYIPSEYGCADFILSKSKTMNHVSFIEHNVKCALYRAKKYKSI